MGTSPSGYIKVSPPGGGGFKLEMHYIRNTCTEDNYLTSAFPQPISGRLRQRKSNMLFVPPNLFVSGSFHPSWC